MSIAGPAVAFVIAAGAIAILRVSIVATWLADYPNERSLHHAARPRVGGLGLLGGALAAAAVLMPLQSAWLVALAAAVALVSLLDDARSLPVAVRLASHFAAAAAVTMFAPFPHVNGPAIPFIVATLGTAAIAWMSNLFNFMDGADGLAGGMAVIGFSTLGLAAQRAGAPDIANLSACIAAASVAFLVFNFPPARVFLGDAGSVPLGFLSGAVGWLGFVRGTWPAWFPLLVFSPFAVDATVTLARRLAAHEPVWRAHRSHYYQRLVLGGWSHRQLALRGWLLMAAVSGSALVAREATPEMRGAILVAWLLAYGAIALVIDRRYPRQESR